VADAEAMPKRVLHPYSKPSSKATGNVRKMEDRGNSFVGGKVLMVSLVNV
jgi:hypothetical protein